MKKRPARLLLSVIALTLAVSAAVLANNPIAVNSGGRATRWATPVAITYTTDGGPLGALTTLQADTLTSDAFGAWSGVGTASVGAVKGAGVLADGDVNTIGEYNAAGCVGVNPIIYDTDGSLTDILLGAGAKSNVLGFAGPCAIQPAANPALNPDIIVGGRATMNGFLITSNVGLAYSKSKGVFIHELGHFLGIGHSQVNLNCLNNQATCPSNTPGGDLFGVPTMFPILLNQTEVASVSYSETLTIDDQSALSTLYPNPNNSFTNTRGALNGNVRFSDGTNEIQGVNVIARQVFLADGVTPGNPRVTAISNVSGMFAQANRGNPALGLAGSSSGSSDPTLRGDFSIPGLPPGTYQLEIESINSSFIGGSRVGALSGSTGRNENVPIPSPAIAECLSLPDTNADGAGNCTNLVLAAGNVLNGNNFTLNETFSAVDASDLAGRNETTGTATPIGVGTISRSLSGPNGADDVDVYALQVTTSTPISATITSRRSATPRYLDSVIQITNAAGVPYTNCTIGDSAAPLYDQPCIGDDYTPTGGSLTKDSKLLYNPTLTGAVFVWVTDRYGDARPDFLYDIAITGVQPPASVIFTPAAWDFGPQFLNIASATKDIKVTNNTATGLSLNAVGRSGNNASEFTFAAPALGPSCGIPLPNGGGSLNIPLAAGGFCYIGVQFKPTGTGARSASIFVQHNGAALDSPVNMALTGTGSAGPLNDNFANATDTAQNPFSDFPDTRLATQEGVDVSLGAAGASPACNISPLPANDHSIWYKFAIPSDLNGVAKIQILPTYAAALAGGFQVGGGGALQFPFCFAVPSGVQSTLNVTTGTNGKSANVVAYFMVASTTDAAPGGNVSFTLTYTPNGTQADLSLAVTDNNLVFTEGTNGVYTVTVSNASGAGATATTPDVPVTVREILPTGFSFVSGGGNGWTCNAASILVTCSLGTTTIAAGGNSQFTITTLPGAPAAANSPVTNFVQVFGGGDITSINNIAFDTTNVNPAPAPVVDIAPPTKDFGSVFNGATSTTQTFTLLNSGNGALNISSISKTGTDLGQFNLLTSPTPGFTCPAGASVLPASASCTFGATFSPTSGGTKSASITVASNASTSPNIVPLAGTGVVPPPNNFTGAISNKWEVAGNWSLGHVPDSTEDVTIGAALSPLIDATTGGRTVKSLTMTSTGTLTISGGSLTINNASTATNITVSGGSLATGPAAGGSLGITGVFNLSNGSQSGNGTLTILGTMNWTGGAITAPSTAPITQIAAGHTLNINGSGPVLSWNLRTIQNAGTINFMGSSDISNASSNTTLINQAGGVLDIQVGHGFFGNYSWTNAGTIKMTGSGGGGFSFGGLGSGPGNAVTSSGTVQALTGSLGLGATYTQTAGSLTVAQDAQVSGGSFAINGGTLSGNGQIQGNVTNAATVNPGSSPGALQIDGNYTQTGTGILNIEIGGTAFGSYDGLFIDGNATLAGTLNATSFGGFTPVAANSFAIMSFSSKSGDFTTNNLTVGGLTLVKNYNATSLAVSGGGGSGFISLDRNFVDFGSREVFTTSPFQTIVFTNTGTGDLTITNVDDGGNGGNDYNVEQPFIAGDCILDGPFLVPAGTSCNLRAHFTPQTIGPRPAHIIITAANASNSGIFFDLTGVGFAGPPASITATGGSLQSAVVSTAFGVPLLASVRDTHNVDIGGEDGPPNFVDITNPVAGAAVTFTVVPAGGAEARFPGNSLTAIVNTDAGGIAVAPTLTANGVAGTYSVTASVAALPVVNYSLTNVAVGGVIRTIVGGGAGAANSICGQSTIGGISGGFYYFKSCSQIFKTPVGGGAWTLVAGTGIPGYSGDGGLATQAELSGITGGIAVDAAGNVFIADFANQRIRKVDGTTNIITTIAGTGTAGYNAGNNSHMTAVTAQLNNPVSVAVDTLGNVYIADSGNHQIRKVSNGSISTIAGSNSGGAGAAGFNGDGFDACCGSQLNNPQGVYVDAAGNIYIADANNQRIRKIDTTGVITTVAGNGTNAFAGDGGLATSASLSQPFNVTADGSGNIFISDINNQRIRKVSGANPKNINTIVGTGSAGYSGDGAAATLAQIFNPGSLYTDGPGNLFFSNLSGVRRVDVGTSGISTVIGNSAFGSGGDGGAATSAQLFSPNGVVRDRFGNIYIADSANYRIRKVNGATGVITTIAGNGTPGTGTNGDGGLATAAQIRPFNGLTVDGSGNVYFVDREVSGTATNCHIRKIDTGGIITSVAGDATCAGSLDNVTASTAGLGSPTSVFADATGNLYIAQQNPSRIRVINTQAVPINANGIAINPGFIRTVAGGGGVLGDGGAATAATVAAPQGLFVDPGGILYIADTNQNRIRKVTTAGIISTVVGTGTLGFNGDSITALTANLSAPSGVYVDGLGNIFIADNNSQRIREVVAGTGLIQPVAGNGVRGSAGDLGQAANANLNTPTNLNLDAAGNIFLTDRLNARIRYVGAVNPVPTIINLVPPTTTFGGPGFVLTVNGTNFVANSFVNFNGNPRATTYVSPTQVTAQILAGDIAVAGNANVTVSNPIPGGGTTANSLFTINSGATITFDGGPGGLGTLWTTAVDWDLDRIPINTDTVVIPTGFNVTLDSGAQTITALNMGGTASLTVTGIGAGLTFTSPSVATNLSIGVGGGTLTANATLAISGALNLSAGGTLNGTGNITLNSTLTWTGGTMSGAGTFNNFGFGATKATITGGTLDGKIFNNSGETDVANLTMSNGAVFNNVSFGSFLDASTAGNGFVQGTGAIGTLNNNSGASFVRFPGPGTYIINGVQFNNRGTLITNGGDWQFTGGPAGQYTQISGSTGINAGNMQVDTPLILLGGTLTGGRTLTGGLANIGGTVRPGNAGAAILTVTSSYAQGPNPSTLEIRIGGTTVGTQYSQVNVTGAPGTVALARTLLITLISGFTPAAGDSFTIVQSTGTISGTFATTNLPALPGRQWNVAYNANSVVLSVTATPGTITFNNLGGDSLWTNPANWDLGRIPVVGDTVVIPGAFNVTLNGGGTHTIAVLTSTGGLTINGGATLITTSPSTATTVSVSGDGAGVGAADGHMTANGTLAVNTLTVNNGGLLDGSGNVTIANSLNLGVAGGGGLGTIGGTGSITVNGGASLSLIAQGALGGKTLNNNAIFGVTSLVMSDGAIFNNLPTHSVNAQSDTSGFVQGSGALSVFNNQGTFTRSVTAGNYTINGVQFNNSGTVTVDNGVLQVIGGPAGQFTQTAGLTQVRIGDLEVSTPLLLQGGTLGGVRTVTGGVNNTGGITRPGNSPGILTVTSTYTQGAGSSMNIEIGGLSAGGFYDRLAVTGAPGTATIGGTLNVTLINPPFAPALGNSFTIVTSTGALTGTFATTNLPALGAGLSWRTTYNNAAPGSVVLDVVAASLALTPDPLAFGNQQVGTTSAAQAITLTNSGGAAATLAAVNAVTITGTHATQFASAAGTTCVNGLVLAAAPNPGNSCIINLTFSPTGLVGPKVASVNVASNALVGPTTAGLSGNGVAPLASIAPPSPFNFGNQPVGSTSAAQIFTVSNGGGPGTNLTITNVQFGGVNAAEFVFNNTAPGACTPLPKVLGPAGICTFTMAFAPTSVANGKTATVTVTDDDFAVPGSQQVLTVNGNGVAATVNMAPNPLQFGNQRKGTSNTMTVTATNSGGLAATLGAISYTGTNAAEFVTAAGTTCGTTVTVLQPSPGPSNTCIINITFTPSGTLLRTATVNLASSAAGSPHTAVLNGTGIAPIAGVAPAGPINFGNQINGTTSAAQTFTVSNTGTDVLNISAIALGGADLTQFILATPGGTACTPLPKAVAAGTNCTFTVAFAPLTSGLKNANVTVTDDNNAVPGSTQVVNLLGTGQTPPTADFSTLNIAFGNKRVGTVTAATTVTITNNGEATLNITALALGIAGDPTQFILTNTGAGSCSPLPKAVLGGGNCTFTAAFAPTSLLPLAAKSATITATHNGNLTGAPGTPTNVALTGTAIQANVTATPNLNFNTQRVGTTSGVQTVTVANNGTDIATLSGPGNPVTLAGANPGDYAIAAGTTCIANFVLTAGGGSCVINITFTPTALGSRPATVQVADDAPGSPQSATLSSSGIQANVTFAPNRDFGNVKVGVTSATMRVTATNSGTDIATLTGPGNPVTFLGANAGDFAIVAGTTTCTAGFVLQTTAPNNTCVVDITFTPGALGARGPVTVRIADDAPGSPQTATLNGTGVLANLTFVPVPPNPLAFGGINLGSNSTMAITVTNTGTLAATLSAGTPVTFTGAQLGDFSNVAGTTCVANFVIAAGGGSCIINVRFTPAALGARAAQVNIANDAPGNPHVVPLTGTGTQPGFTLTGITTQNLGSVQVGMTAAGTAVTVTNPVAANAGPLTITSITVVAGGANPAAADFSRTTTCPLAPATLASGASCTITPSMGPQAGSVGPRTANISIVHDAAGSPGTITLSGAAVDFAIISTATPGPTAAGGTVMYSFNFDTLGGNSLFPTTFACTAGLPRKAECIFTPSSLPAGSPDTTVTLAISTTSNTATVSQAGVAAPMIPTGGGLPPGGWMLISMSALGSFAVATFRRRALHLSAARLCLLALVLGAGGYLTGCANPDGGGFPEGASGTPPGNYTVTVTATEGTVQRTTTVTLNVQ